MCEHTRVDHRGSSSTVRRAYCIDCGQCLSGTSQQEARERVRIAQEVEGGRDDQFRTVHRLVSQDRAVDAEQLARVLDLFSCGATRQVQFAGSAQSSALVSLLQDAVDAVVDDTEYTACLCVATTEVEQDTKAPQHSQVAFPAMVADPPPCSLRSVDPLADDDVWAELGEGCNSTCHGQAWMGNAEDKLIARGFMAKWVHRNTKQYSGIGGATARGLKTCPYSLRPSRSGMTVCGIMESHELGSDVPLLLSLQAQAKLGLIKDVRRGRCRMADYDGDELELARHCRSGLFMINISQFRDFEQDPMPAELESHLIVLDPECGDPIRAEKYHAKKNSVSRTSFPQAFRGPPPFVSPCP